MCPSRRVRRANLIAALLGLAVSVAALADPVAAVDRYPLARLFAPPPVTSADFERGDRPVVIDADWGSFATVSVGPSEQLVFDGEFAAVTGRIQWRRGAWRFGLDVPLVYQSGGLLDSLIDDWHDVFGLPEGDRPVLPTDELRVFFEDAQGVGFNVTNAGWGLGETHLHVGRSLRSSPDRASALRLHIKLPTGRTATLLGSGTVGLGAEWHGVRRAALRARPVTWFGGIGGMWHDGSDVLPGRFRRFAAFAHGGVRLELSEALSAVVQADYHSAFFDGALNGLDAGVSLTVGGRWQRAGGDAFEFTVYEDISVRSVPDVTFQFRWLSRASGAPSRSTDGTGGRSWRR